MSTVNVKHEFCDCSFEIFEEAGILSTMRRDEIATLKLTVVDPADKRLIQINVIRITYDGDLEVAHNLPTITKTNYSSAIRSQRDSYNMKNALRCFPKTVLCSTTTKGLMVVKIRPTRKKPPHRFDPIVPYWAFNTHTRGLV